MFVAKKVMADWREADININAVTVGMLSGKVSLGHHASAGVCFTCLTVINRSNSATMSEKTWTRARD